MASKVTLTAKLGKTDIKFDIPTDVRRGDQNYSANIMVTIHREQRGDPKFPRDYRPEAEIDFEVSQHDLRELVETLDRLI